MSYESVYNYLTRGVLAMNAIARSLRIATIQNAYDNGLINKDEALEILSGPLSPGNPDTVFDDRDQLKIKPEDE